jgi:transposase InsO family protein
VGDPGRRSCGDIIHIPTGEGWLYLTDALDLGSRRVVGHVMDVPMPIELIEEALEVAIGKHGGQVDPMLFHHDRDSISLTDFRLLCASHGIAQSVGRIDSSRDNAVAESFWATLKRELDSRCRFETRADARQAMIAWIRRDDNVGLHSSLGNVPPIEWERCFEHRQPQAA